MTADLTAPQLAWAAAGRPAPEGKTGSQFGWIEADAAGPCACCGGAMPGGRGVPFETRGRAEAKIQGIDNQTFSGHAEYLRWGEVVCAACAWFFGDPKRMHRSLLVVGAAIWWPSISDAGGRDLWEPLLDRLLAGGHEAMTGVLTVDPKPRLWPRMQLASAAAPGLYVHAPNWDVSAWLEFDPGDLATTAAAVRRALTEGWARDAVVRGGWTPKPGRFAAWMAIEAELAPLRGSPELIIAAIVTRGPSKSTEGEEP